MATETNVRNKLVNVEYDNVSVTYPTSTSEIYEFKQGGAVLQTVTVVYTDATKENISTVTRS